MKSTKVLSLIVLASLASCSSAPQKQTAIFSEPTLAMDETEVDYSRAPASECDSDKYKECKNARKNDTADMYMLSHEGTLFRRINGTVCAVTSKVEDFKISQHPKDVAVIYYKALTPKTGTVDLYLVNLDKEVRKKGECPSAKGNTKMLKESVTKFTVTSNIHTTIVNAALTESGEFLAWDNDKVVYRDSGVEEFQMNNCYGSEKSFNSYVLFTRDRSDSITKVRVEGDRFLKDTSKSTSESYSNISDFKKKNNVCK